MNKHHQNIIFGVGIGILLALNIFVNIYKQPKFDLDISQFNYNLITQDGKDLGIALSTIKLKYIPGRNWGKFLLLIETNVSKPYLDHSISSKDIKYKIVIKQNSRIIEQIESNYLGSLSSQRRTVMYRGLFLPSVSHPMNDIRSTFGKILLNFEGSFYNTSNNNIMAINNIDVNIFIIHPSTRFVFFSFLLIFPSIFLIIGSGPSFKKRISMTEKKQ
jgi:hypothetical protein